MTVQEKVNKKCTKKQKAKNTYLVIMKNNFENFDGF